MFGTITMLLDHVRAGAPGARDALMNRVYPELQSVARAVLGHRRAGTMNATALVHSAWVRLTKRDAMDAENRAHFFFKFHRAMMDEFIEYTRRARAKKRPQDDRRETLYEMPGDGEPLRAEFIDLAEAMVELEQADAVSARIVVLKHFVGYTLEETAEKMAMTNGATRQNWEYAKAWLHARLSK